MHSVNVNRRTVQQARRDLSLLRLCYLRSTQLETFRRNAQIMLGIGLYAGLWRTQVARADWLKMPASSTRFPW